MIQEVGFELEDDVGRPVKVTGWRFTGAGDAPSAYLQAGVHADEIPGMLVLHKLMARLHEAEASGLLRGTVTIVPQANPFGIGQFRQGRILGRFHDATGRNFNRGFLESIAAQTPRTNLEIWQKKLVALAADADIILDLHTDDEALPYIYFHKALWPAARDLSAALGSSVAILWDDMGDGAFEEAAVLPWLEENNFEGRIATTIELRGQADVDDRLAQQDVDGLYDFLCARGVIAQDVTLPDWKGIATPTAHMETLFAPAAGVLIFERALGEIIEEGAIIARIFPLPGRPESEHLVRAPQTGLFLTRYRDRLVPQGAIVAKLAANGPSTTWTGGVLDP